MTSYTAIADTEIDAESPVTEELMTRLRDNPIATAEAASGSPVISSCWHPYDKVTHGDSNDGVIYDFAVDGSLSSIVSPDFVDGWEYRFEFYDWSGSVATSDAEIQFYLETSASYSSSRVLQSFTSTSDNLHGAVELRKPRLSRDWFYWVNETTIRNLNAPIETQVIDLGSAQKILRVRFLFSAGSANGGTITMYKRKAL